MPGAQFIDSAPVKLPNQFPFTGNLPNCATPPHWFSIAIGAAPQIQIIQRCQAVLAAAPISAFMQREPGLRRGAKKETTLQTLSTK
jgi:hypothetical protein